MSVGGSGVRALGVDLLEDTPDSGGPSRGSVLLGRLPHGPVVQRAPTTPLVVAGRRAELPANFPDGSAIHGEVYDAPWAVVGESTLRIEAGGGAWPWRYDVHARFRAASMSCGLTVELRNLDDAPMPAGIGLHVVRAVARRRACPACSPTTSHRGRVRSRSSRRTTFAGST